MTDKGNLSSKERALIEAARRELSARTANPLPQAPAQPHEAATAPAPSPGATTAPAQTAALPPQVPPTTARAPVPAPDAAARHAARIAALMAAEREETQRRRDKVKRWGIHFPMALFATALAWLALRQFG